MQLASCLTDSRHEPRRANPRQQASQMTFPRNRSRSGRMPRIIPPYPTDAYHRKPGSYVAPEIGQRTEITEIANTNPLAPICAACLANNRVSRHQTIFHKRDHDEFTCRAQIIAPESAMAGISRKMFMNHEETARKQCPTAPDPSRNYAY